MIISPSESWERVEDGHEKDGTGVYVESVSSRPASEADAYAVSIVENLGTASERHHVQTQFEDRQSAWELANILTRYIDYVGDVSSVRNNLSQSPYLNEGGFREHSTDAETAFRKALGENEHQTDEILK